MKEPRTEEESGMHAAPSLISDSDGSCKSTCAVPDEVMETSNAIADLSQLWVDSFKRDLYWLSKSKQSDTAESDVYYRGGLFDGKNVSNIGLTHYT